MAKFKIHPTAVIGDNVIIQDGVEIGPFCIIGLEPESFKARGQNQGVLIMEGTKIHGACTIDGGIDGPTIIGKQCYIMKQTHIGHDADLGDKNILAPGARIGGYVKTGPHCYFGMNSTVHPRVEIGKGVLLGQLSSFIKSSNPWDFSKWAGSPAGLIGPNTMAKEKCDKDGY